MIEYHCFKYCLEIWGVTEAHYKKIAARKVEIMEEEQKMGEDLFRLDTPCKENSINNDYGTKVEFGTLGVNGITCSMEPNKNSLATTYCTLNEELNHDRSGVNRQGSFVEGVEEEGDDLPDSPKSSEFEGAVLVSDENQYVEPQAQLEVEFNSTNEDCRVM
ncbi:hypothetical protein IFM89_011512 [Coptis chinensis]|uniref:Uncharacterized protein n=1 Tax=Coptis chinensis TaxID=261450 RepID=A0A835IC29_9MAGN|nr:hypothetical protein IFM89_011512 [Coptis chinensis]